MSSLTITGIQANLCWEDKKANLQMLEEKILSISVPTEIVVLPEMFSTGFSMHPEKFAEPMPASGDMDGAGETLKWMRRIALQKKIVITGSLIIKDRDHYFNRLIWMLPNAQLGYYDKRHLFGYADEDQHYTAGSKRLIASIKGWKLNLLVCYDLRFPVWSRQASPYVYPSATTLQNRDENNRLEYDVLIYVANWPDRRIHAWKTLLQARAIENQCYVVGVNRVGEDGNKIYYPGDSMVIDPAGDILYHAGANEDTFTISLDQSHLMSTRQKFPFWKDADKFNIEN